MGAPLFRTTDGNLAHLKEKLMASEGLHEPAELLGPATIDYHRAMTSLCEELEAIDWYDQRVKATQTPAWPPFWPTTATRRRSTPP